MFEHPATAVSWATRTLSTLRGTAGVREVVGDMCAFGLVSVDCMGTGAVRKRTRFLTNSPHLAIRLNKRCTNSGSPRDRRHVHLLDGRAHGARIYPDALCDALCRGVRDQKTADSIVKDVNSIGATFPNSVSMLTTSRVTDLTPKRLNEHDTLRSSTFVKWGYTPRCPSKNRSQCQANDLCRSGGWTCGRLMGHTDPSWLRKKFVHRVLPISLQPPLRWKHSSICCDGLSTRSTL